jgi:CRISPR-associated protein Csb2
MLVRIEVLYPHQTVVGEQFPPSPSTVFQAIVAANGHRLDKISDVLQLMESGKCMRITQHCETAPISLRTAVPRMPKAGEAHNFKFDDPANKLLEPQKVFPLDGNGVHLSYYFELVSVARGRLTDALKLHVLGRGESACMSRVSVLDSLPDTEGGIVWEPSALGQRRLDVPYPGFLRNLLLYHYAGKPNSKVPRRSATFSVKNSVTPYSAICYRLVDENGDTFSYPQENMADVSAMMRHAMIVATQGKLDGAYVSGHTKAHPFYLPVPSIGAEHADGDIRRIIVAEPAGLGLLSSNLAAITSLPLKDDRGKLVCYAVREPDEDGVFSRYLGTSKTLRTVTPMILDRTGGERRIGKRIGALITKAGFPKPIRITFNKTWWAGKLPVPVSRAQVYVDVEFPVKVSGPLAAGVAAGYGIGLFART